MGSREGRGGRKLAAEKGWWPFWEGGESGRSRKTEGPGCVREEG